MDHYRVSRIFFNLVNGLDVEADIWPAMLARDRVENTNRTNAHRWQDRGWVRVITDENNHDGRRREIQGVVLMKAGVEAAAGAKFSKVRA